MCLGLSFCSVGRNSRVSKKQRGDDSILGPAISESTARKDLRLPLFT